MLNNTLVEKKDRFLVDPDPNLLLTNENKPTYPVSNQCHDNINLNPAPCTAMTCTNEVTIAYLFNYTNNNIHEKNYSILIGCKQCSFSLTQKR